MSKSGLVDEWVHEQNARSFAAQFRHISKSEVQQDLIASGLDADKACLIARELCAALGERWDPQNSLQLWCRKVAMLATRGLPAVEIRKMLERSGVSPEISGAISGRVCEALVAAGRGDAGYRAWLGTLVQRPFGSVLGCFVTLSALCATGFLLLIEWAFLPPGRWPVIIVAAPAVLAGAAVFVVVSGALYKLRWRVAAK